MSPLPQPRAEGPGVPFAPSAHYPDPAIEVLDPAFLKLPNAVITPHQASATVETRVAMGEAVLANLSAHFAGARPPAVVN